MVQTEANETVGTLSPEGRWLVYASDSAKRAPDLVALDSLAKIDERKGRMVELCFFGGLSVEEAAFVLEVAPETVMRDWRRSTSGICLDQAYSPSR